MSVSSAVICPVFKSCCFLFKANVLTYEKMFLNIYSLYIDFDKSVFYKCVDE